MSRSLKIPKFLKFKPTNWVPITRTPWGGECIPAIKRQLGVSSVPQRIGESWEVSTDSQFPSVIAEGVGEGQSFSDILQDMFFAKQILGTRIFESFGSHCPLLLKWIHSNEALSVQVHPGNGHSTLGPNECGKPESWLVLDTQAQGHIFAGFEENLGDSNLETGICSAHPAPFLNRMFPQPGDYIAIPVGLVHALGPGVVVAEPQLVLPGRMGKTFRLSDWGRRYNARGERDDKKGEPRELHVHAGLNSIDWSLPRGPAVSEYLVYSFKESNKWFLGNRFNPFACCVWKDLGDFFIEKPFLDQFILLTCWAGEAHFKIDNESSFWLKSGESAIVCASAHSIWMRSHSNLNFQNKFGIAAFALNLGYL